MAQLRAYFLGPLQVTRDDQHVTGFESDKMRALLAYLLIETERPHRREALAALLWPDQTDMAARQSLRQALYVLRHILGSGDPRPGARKHLLDDPDPDAGPLLVTRQTVQFNLGRDTWCDVALFKHLLAACKAHQQRSGHTDRCAECIQRLHQATDLYRGEFLQGFLIADNSAFEEWMLLERETHHRQMLRALERLADYYEEAGEHEQSLHFALWQVKLEPWREEAHRQAMRLLSRTGQRSAALAQYEACRQTLAAELGLEPARETTALYARIRDAETEHPPERPAGGRAVLPMAATPLIGREAEVTAVVEQLLRDEVRLLTVTGPGGTGKTRIALRAATDLQTHFAGGAYFVNLAPLTDPGLVAATIATVLGVKELPGKTVLDSIVSYLQGKQALLLLDNFEQVADAAPLIGHLVRSTSGVKALVTSRVALRLRGMHEYPVPPMALPDRRHLPALERLTAYEGIRLFVERAAALKPGFQLTEDNAAAVVEICHRLDGLPLAIELAAARIRVLPPQAMLVRLQSRLELVASKDRDVPTRQQTLRHTLDWSYNLLDAAERALFRRLAAFQGGRTLEAIQAVCALSDHEADLLDGIEALISASLLQQREGQGAEGRFWMLETIHEYAGEKLRESGEEVALRRRHARYFMAFAEQAAPHLKQEDQVRWLEQVEAENDNLRAAFHWARECGEAGDSEAAETGLRLAIALERFWQVRVYLREGLEQTLSILALSRPGGAVRATALRVAASLADVRGEYPIAHSLLEESLQIWRALGDTRNLIDTLHSLGIALYNHGDYMQARAIYEESLGLDQAAGDRKTALHHLGLIVYELGDFAHAGALWEEALALERALGDTRRVALMLADLGLVAYEQGEYALALARHQESLTIRRVLGAKLGIAYSLEGLAMLYRAMNSPEKAARLWGASQALRDAIGTPVPPIERTRYTRDQAIVRTQLGAEAFDRACAEGRAMASDEAVAYALAEPAGQISGLDAANGEMPDSGTVVIPTIVGKTY
jgi:predicted ATPase/DNA-binding SARP family transcriptional activator